MTSKNSYSYQKDLLVKLQESLETFREEMSNVARTYKGAVQSLHEEQGMMDETYEEYYINYLNPTVEVLNNLLERIDNEDIAFIEKEISFLSSR